MGRRSLATKEQGEYLSSFLEEVPKAKAIVGELKRLYTKAALGFLERWPPKPIITGDPTNPEVPDQEAINQVHRVGAFFSELLLLIHHLH